MWTVQLNGLPASYKIIVLENCTDPQTKVDDTSTPDKFSNFYFEIETQWNLLL